MLPFKMGAEVTIYVRYKPQCQLSCLSCCYVWVQVRTGRELPAGCCIRALMCCAKIK
jgi:hypothetical protein